MQPRYQESYKDYVIAIYHDEDARNPREECDHLGRMICFHRRYNLGDKHELPHEQDHIEFKEWIEKSKDIISLPIYLYDHSGLAMNTVGFSGIDSMRWDWGLVGFIYVTKKKTREEYGKLYKTSRITKAMKDTAIKVLESEVIEYNQYLSGDVWGYVIRKGDEEIDSCWGFYGFDYCLQSAKETID